MTRWVFRLSLAILAGCSSFEDLRCEGEAETRKLAAELRAIETKEDLQKAVPRLKKRFNRIADLVIEARSFHGGESEPTAASEELFIELARLYEVAGGRELIESAQTDAVLRLKR
jgi:nitric oxide reductase activation protein